MFSLEQSRDGDVAVLKIDEGNNSSDTVFAAMKFGSSSDLLVGQSLIAIGNPFGLDNTVTTGVVSALNRELKTGDRIVPIRNCIETECAINPGNSGGPLLNLKGEVVGVNTAIVTMPGSNAGIGFAIPANQVQPAVTAIIRKDASTQNDQNKRKAYLGVSILKTSGTANTQNWVRAVLRDSPAAKAGVKGLRRASERPPNLGGCSSSAIRRRDCCGWRQ